MVSDSISPLPEWRPASSGTLSLYVAPLHTSLTPGASPGTATATAHSPSLGRRKRVGMAIISSASGAKELCALAPRTTMPSFFFSTTLR